jgi:hypothetical protein
VVHEASFMGGEANFTHGLVRLILNELRFIQSNVGRNPKNLAAPDICSSGRPE